MMATKPRGRPPSAKTLVDRQLGRNVKHPVLPAGESFVIPNHSGDHSEGRVDKTPTADLDLVNKKYVDGEITSKAWLQAVAQTGLTGNKTGDFVLTTTGKTENSPTIVVRQTDDGGDAIQLISNNVFGYIRLLSGGIGVQLNPNGASYFVGGKLGIGTTNPLFDLQIDASGQDAIYSQRDDNCSLRITNSLGTSANDADFRVGIFDDKFRIRRQTASIGGQEQEIYLLLMRIMI